MGHPEGGYVNMKGSMGNPPNLGNEAGTEGE